MDGSSLAGRRFLIAEDDPASRELLSFLLRMGGAVVEAVGNGQDALRTWEDSEFDAVLMDVQMPVMDGVEAARMIREAELNSERSPRTTIIAVTAQVSLSQHCLDAGMDSVITKPIDPLAFCASVRRAIDAR
jgi:CheY-like chemotaxis protein